MQCGSGDSVPRAHGGVFHGEAIARGLKLCERRAGGGRIHLARNVLGAIDIPDVHRARNRLLRPGPVVLKREAGGDVSPKPLGRAPEFARRERA